MSKNLLDSGRATVRSFAGHQLEQGATQAVNVGAMIRRTCIFPLFGSHVIKRPQDLICLRDLRRLLLSGLFGGRLFDGRQPHVHDLDCVSLIEH